MICSEGSIESLKEYTTALVTFLSINKTLIDSYTLDYFVENSWQKLPRSWQNVLEELELQDIGIFLDFNQKLRLKKVWPLSLLTYRAAAFSLAISRQPVQSSKPVEIFLNEVLEGKMTNIVDLHWGETSLEFNNNCCQHRGLPAVFRKHVKPKKQHEIFRMSQLVNLVLCNLNIKHIIDVGAGLGHLSRLLTYLYNFKVVTVDCVSSYASAAESLDNEVSSSLKKNQGYPKYENSISETAEGNINNKSPCHIEHNITLNTSKETFHNVLKDVWPENVNVEKSQFSLLGLHTCGDLAATLLKLFIEMPEAQVLFSVACCYMKLSENNDGCGYPLSSYLKQNAHSSLSYQAKELCCHALEGYIQKLNGMCTSLKIHCYRAILEKIIVDHHPTMKHVGLRSVKNAANMSFVDYANKALNRCSLVVPEEVIKSPINNEYLKEWKKIVILYSLRLLTAPVIESLILIDRMLCLFENGCSSCIYPIFDPSLSPRNHILLACKK